MSLFLRRAGALNATAEAYGDTLTGAETMGRLDATDFGVSLVASQQAFFTFFTPSRSATVSTFVTNSGGTAAGATPTLCRVGLYTSDGTTLTLVARTANTTSLWAATFTEYATAMDATGGYVTSYTLIGGQRYAIGLLCVSAAAIPQLYGVQPVSGATISRAPILGRTLTGQADLPTSQAIAGTAANNRLFWVGVV